MQIYFFTKIERKIYMAEEERKEILASNVQEEMLKGVERFDIK